MGADDQARAARELALRGDFGAVDAYQPAGEPAGEGWAACFEIMRAGAGLIARGVDLRALPSSVGSGYACVEGARDALARMDLPALGEANAVLGRVMAEVDDAPLALAAAWVALWTEALTRPDVGLVARAESLLPGAQALGDAELLVELASFRAFVLLCVGDLDGATKVARRASRMGRTESMPQQEYLANLVLARLRRATGRPHLATRILTALAQVAPARWQGWLAWELTLAGALDAAAEARERAHAGVLGEASAKLLGGAPGAPLPPPFEEERRAIAAALGGPTYDPVEPWCEGRTAETPAALHGVLLLPDARGDRRPRVFVRPGAGARRMLAAGAQDDAHFFAEQAPHPRTETALAVLAQAGDAGLPRAALFEAVYGFAFDEVLHQGNFDVLLHRARAWLGERGSIERSAEGVLRLHPSAAFVVPDPRCERSLDDRLLQLLAEHGSVGAREAAAQLAVPLRTVQTLLKQLVEDGACETQREGRRVLYAVEDTTFREPTKV